MGRASREREVLLGLIDLFIETGRPVGSNTLKEKGFDHLSSATIRNYFARLEEEGLLTQQHASGGRFPTQAAFRFYADSCLAHPNPHYHEPKEITELRDPEGKEIASFLQHAADTLNQLTKCSVFLSAPRFDHDFVTDIKLVPIDSRRCVCVIVTDFGVIQTELFHSEMRLSPALTKRFENYFRWRLAGSYPPSPRMDPDEEETAQTIYNEMMIRYIVGYSHFSDEEVYKTGLSSMLHYPEFHDPSLLANSLALFENPTRMRHLLREVMAHPTCRVWIGDELEYYTDQAFDAAVLAIPYHIHQHPAGAIGILGPSRLPYKDLFPLLDAFANMITETLTKMVYKFKIQYRQPDVGKPYISQEEHRLIGQSRLMLLEKKNAKEKI